MARKRDLSQYMTHREASASLGIALSSVYEAVRRGELKTEEVLGKTVLLRSSVEAFTPRPYPRQSHGTGRATPEEG